MRGEEEQEFWRENQNMNGNGWTWTLAVVLLIFTYSLLSSPFRRRLRLRFRRHHRFFGRPSSSSSSLTKPEAVSVPPIRASGIISDLDLKNLIDDLKDNSPDNVWENVIDKSNNSISYKAKCCKPKDGPLKYMSVTTFEDCSVETLVNFYMDNNYRTQWDKTVVRHQQLQLDHDSCTEIGRTIKKFPFLTPREYVLAWKLWQGIDGSFYCFSKECEHPSAPKEKGFVRVAVFRSGWRIRKVPGRNASEIKMVHQEDAGLNVEMAKMAFAKGIWSYVCKMDDALRRYSAGKQHTPNSTAAVSLPIQKVPPELEAANDTISTVHPENSTASISQHPETCMRKLRRMPSNKLIANGLVLLGGAIFLSRGHSSLGTKVAMAYLASKLTKRDAASSNKTANVRNR